MTKSAAELAVINEPAWLLAHERGWVRKGSLDYCRECDIDNPWPACPNCHGSGWIRTEPTPVDALPQDLQKALETVMAAKHTWEGPETVDLVSTDREITATAGGQENMPRKDVLYAARRAMLNQLIPHDVVFIDLKPRSAK